MRSTAVAQADHLLPAEAVQLLGHDGALAVPCTQAITAVQPKHVHLYKSKRPEMGVNDVR